MKITVVHIIAAIAAFLFLSNSSLFAVLPGGICYTPGSSVSLVSDPIKVVTQSPNAFYCLVTNYWSTSGQLKYASTCTNIGAVSAGQILNGRTMSFAIPPDAQPSQSPGANIFVSTVGQQTTADASDVWLGRISEIDSINYFIQSSCPVLTSNVSSSGERTVNYFRACNADKTSLEICTRESYTSISSQCVSSMFVACPSGSSCQTDSTGKVGFCISNQVQANCNDPSTITSRNVCLQCNGKWVEPGIISGISNTLFGGQTDPARCEIGIQKTFGDLSRMFSNIFGVVTNPWLIALGLVLLIVLFGRGVI